MGRVQIVCMHRLSCTTLEYCGMRCRDGAGTILLVRERETQLAGQSVLPCADHWTRLDRWAFEALGFPRRVHADRYRLEQAISTFAVDTLDRSNRPE